MITAFIIGILAAVGTMAVITVLTITAEWVIKKVKERLAANNRHKPIFVDVEEVRDSEVKERRNKQKEYSMDELGRICQETPYILADYDQDTGEVVNFTGIKAEGIESDVKSRLKEVGGLVVFS